jgi:hypothetical protein
MPINETTHANATAQTARGCLKGLTRGASGVDVWELMLVLPRIGVGWCLES